MELTPVWQQVTKLLDDGISVIPVRDRDEMVNGELKKKKSPYRKWEKYQEQLIDQTTLWAEMERNNTTAIAMICGAVSGNMEVIDVDVKWMPGIDATLLTDLNNLYPDLLARLRVHSTPSGGCHILYRTTQQPPGNQKLARRLSTPEELEADPKRNKSKCFIETRGEGGFVVAPPSIGYGVRSDNPIPLLTWEQRCTLINFCCAYNTYFTQERPPAAARADDQYYDENPFEDYNNRVDAAQLFEQSGWTYVKQSGKFLWFTKPGGQRGDVHGTFNLEKRYFYIWTTDTDLEPRGYLPASILCHYQFKGDKKACYHWLVQQGYGKIKPHMELQIIQRHVITGKPLPPNISPTGAAQYATASAVAAERYPYGIYWQIDDKGKIQIDREGIYQVAEGLGYRWHAGVLVQVVGHIVHKPDERTFYDCVKAYIQEEDGDLYRDICNAYEAFIQKNGEFSITRLPLLDANLLMQDTRTHCFKFYANCWLEITATDILMRPYSELPPRLIWAEQVQPREYTGTPQPACKYIQFLELAIGPSEQLMRIIGYMAHQYKDDTTGYIIVLTEQCDDPQKGGGSGKNIFTKLFSHNTTIKILPGSQVQFNEKLLQAWNYERLLAFSDVKKKFDFEFLKSLSTDAGLLKKLYKDDVAIPIEDLPKFIVLTNFSVEITDGGLKRRIIILEFTDFFTKVGGVDVHFGCHFPTGWTPEDWAGYDYFTALCIQQWLAHDLKLLPTKLTTGGWLKQFDQEFGRLTREFIEQHWDDWRGAFVSNNRFNQQYAAYLAEQNSIVKLSSIKMNKALAAWCQKHHYLFAKDASQKVNGITERGREFMDEIPF